MLIGVLHLGWSACQLLIARVAEGALVRVEAASVPARPFVDERGALDAVATLLARARAFAPDRLLVVAASALRDAGTLLARAGELAPIELLSPAEEAFLAYRGARASFTAVGDGYYPSFVHFLPLGLAPLRERLVPGDGHVSEATGAAIARLAHELGGQQGLARELPAHSLTRLRVILSKFKPSGLAELGVEETRIDTLATGVVVLETLMDLLRAPALTVTDGSLREGLALRELRRHELGTQLTVADGVTP